MFKKNKIDIKKLLKRVQKEAGFCKSCLQFMEDYGNYKRVKDHYRLSDYEAKEKLKEIKNQILTLQISMTIATEVISQSKKQTELFVKINEDLNQEFLNLKNKYKEK